ncbi:cupredoxin domain-containing protein [Candidatus Woesearchaeota archaeon]|nr:cupredoxin domain-containing protein [Candidatus Woesearchaeota archaeon]
MSRQQFVRHCIAVGVTIFLVILLSSCSGQQNKQSPTPVEPAQPSEAAPVQDVGDQPSGQPSPSLGRTVEIDAVARNYEFVPDVIRVKQGDTVVLHMTAEDDGAGSGHGVSIPALGVDITLRKGKTEDIMFVAKYKGEFPFSCSVFCGSGHGSMKGKLIVE